MNKEQLENRKLELEMELKKVDNILDAVEREEDASELTIDLRLPELKGDKITKMVVSSQILKHPEAITIDTKDKFVTIEAELVDYEYAVLNIKVQDK